MTETPNPAASRWPSRGDHVQQAIADAQARMARKKAKHAAEQAAQNGDGGTP